MVGGQSPVKSNSLEEPIATVNVFMYEEKHLPSDNNTKYCAKYILTHSILLPSIFSCYSGCSTIRDKTGASLYEGSDW